MIIKSLARSRAARTVSRVLLQQHQHQHGRRKLSMEPIVNASRRRVQTELSFAHIQNKFDAWRREHAIMLLVTGGVLGAGAMFGLVYVYILENPKALEKLIVNRTAYAFSKALTFEARKKIYFGLPDVTLPVASNSDLLAKNAVDADRDEMINNWADAVSLVLDEAGSSFVLMAKALMRRELVSEANQFKTFEDRLSALREILPYPSIERDILIEAQLNDRLFETGWLDSKLLEENPPSTSNPAPTCDPLTKILTTAIAFFPGPATALIQYLSDEQVLPEEAVFSTRLARRASALFTSDRSGKEPHDDETKVARVFFELRHLYRDMIDNGRIRDYVLETALATTIDTIYNMKLKKPYDAYVTAIDLELLGPLRRDARITEDILDQVKRIFLAAPPGIQARILLTALRHPYSKPSQVSPDEQARVVRDLLSAGGVVAVKLAQMLAEDPKIPANYRKLLGELRDDNAPMSVTEFWHAIPQTVRKRITALGPCLGVGSVKQVHRARFEDGTESAVAVLRKNVEDEALASLNALEASQELGVVAKRLGRLVYGEFNLFGEGEALGDFAATRIGTNPKFRVVKVIHHSPKCLVEEIAQGPTLAKALSSPNATPFDTAQVKKLLTEYHRAVFSAFIYDGLIHSDIHLGNAVLVRRKPPTPQDDGLGLVLFDVGQWERIGQADTKALLWVLGSISSVERRKSLREAALTSLQGVSHLSDVEHQTVAPENDPKLREAIEKSFSEAIAPFEDGTFPDQRQAYMLFLRACERNGVSLPKGAFSVAKMIDGILSQKQQFNLHDVAEEMMEGFMRKNMTWWEASSVLKGTISTTIGRNSPDALAAKAIKSFVPSVDAVAASVVVTPDVSKPSAQSKSK